MNPIRHCAFAVVLSLAVKRLPAQRPPAPARGDRVRVTSADRRATGTLKSIDCDCIVVRRSNGALTKFARAPRPRLDVSTGAGMCGEGRRATCVIGGFLGGALVGLGAGAIVGGGCNGDELCGIQYVFTIPAGALVGIIVGSVIGGEHLGRAHVPPSPTFRPQGPGRVAGGGRPPVRRQNPAPPRP